MKYYLYNGKIYRSHNRDTLARKLVPTRTNNWGEKVKKGITAVKKNIYRLYGYYEE